MSSITKHVVIQVSLIILALVVLAILFFVGIYVCFTVIGKGNGADAFSSGTWQHILEFMK